MAVRLFMVSTYMAIIQIFRITFLKKRYGKDKAFLLTTILYAPISLYVYTVVGNEYLFEVLLILAINVANILLALYLIHRHKNQNQEK